MPFRKVVVLCVISSVMAVLGTGSVLASVDPARIDINLIDPEINVGGKTDIYYNVYNDKGEVIGTLDTWEYTNKDIANITEYPGANHFQVEGLKGGTVKFTITATGNTKTVSNSVNITVKAKDGGGSNGGKKGLPGFEGVFVTMALMAALFIAGTTRRPRK